LTYREDFIKTSASVHGEARITITSSGGYKVVRKLDYDLFRSPIPPTAKSVLSTTKESMKRYINSKLGVLYIAMELDRRLQAAGVKNVRVNAVHPGQHSLDLLTRNLTV
jgi:NAD(P)-dependent dehydrogenase (short-subunit alcohol dehydrogenase family)